MGCLAKKNSRGEIKEKGKATIEWYKDGKPQYYCYGYIDRRTDEPLEECKQCKKFVWQADEDLEKYIKNRKLGGLNNE